MVIDSVIPNSHPFIFIIAITLTTIPPIEIIEYRDTKIFYVTINNITNPIAIDIIEPSTAFLTKAFSVSIHAKNIIINFN